jgi:chemotaxis protein MotB
MTGHTQDGQLEEFWPAYVDILLVVSLILVMLVLTFVLARPDTRVREERERRKAEFARAFERVMGNEVRAGLATLLSPPGEMQAVTFADQLLFDSGDATLRRPRGRESLKHLATLCNSFLKRPGGPLFETLVVNGHTDEDPITTAPFPSNWHLSSARATSVVYFFVQHGVEPGRLSAVGYGEHRARNPITLKPIVEKARKRRIEVVISYPEAFISRQLAGRR